MKKNNLDFKTLILLCFLGFSGWVYAQLGFCQGNSGDPIFTETFGTGTNYGPALPSGTTTYSFIGNSGPQDGEYTIGRNTFSYGWNLPNDHTGDTNGKCLIVNASYTAGEFYRATINGLCENTTYEFSSWLINILPSSGCNGNGIPVNVRFEIWDVTDTNLLASGDTGNIAGQNTPTWQQYGLVFQTLVGQTSVILKMKNNSVGGCGNDLAIDDIVFKSCGDTITVEDSNNNTQVAMCSQQTPYSDTITAVPDNTVFSTHFYQWQVSTDNTNWTDINGETNQALSFTNVTQTTYYRAKVAEYQANLTNSDCITFSDVFQIIINPSEEEPTNLPCWQTATFNTANCTWSVTGTQPEAPETQCWQTATFNTNTCAWEVTGTQPAEPTDLACWQTTTFNSTSCQWEITGTEPVVPTLECWQTSNFNTTTCQWEVSGTQPPEPTNLDCWQTATFNNTSCAWEITGTQPETPETQCWQTATFNTNTCTWEVTGTQPPEPTGLECWETATFNTNTCAWEVTGTQPPEPTNLECWQTAVFDDAECQWHIIGTQEITYREENAILCEDNTLTLQANTFIENATYLWSTNQQTASIVIETEGTYIVEATDGCISEIITFNVSLEERPVIDKVVTEYTTIIINTLNNGNYWYSLNGVDYQSSNIFYGKPSGLYTVYVKSNLCDFVTTQQHLHFYIPKFFTPNNDGKNDYFSINALEYFLSSEVMLFNRYGKLLYYVKNDNVNWDGTFNKQPLPTSDYWYIIRIEDKEFKGHFTLKR